MTTSYITAIIATVIFTLLGIFLIEPYNQQIRYEGQIILPFNETIRLIEYLPHNTETIKHGSQIIVEYNFGASESQIKELELSKPLTTRDKNHYEQATGMALYAVMIVPIFLVWLQAIVKTLAKKEDC